MEHRTVQYLLEFACIAGFVVKDIEYYFPGATLKKFPTKALIAVLLGRAELTSDEESKPAELGRAFQQIESMNTSTEAYQWLSGLFWKAQLFAGGQEEPSIAERLAANFWEALTGSENAGRDRSYLLHILQRLKRTDALKHLAREYARPYDHLVCQCLAAYKLAEVNPSARSTALQLSTALQMYKAKTKTNMKPWILFFNKLAMEQAEIEEPPLRQDPEVALVEIDKQDTAVLEIRLVPSNYDPPETLNLELPQSIYEGEPLVLTAEEFFAEKTFVLRVPAAPFQSAVEFISVPYRLFGRTIRGREVDIRRSWDIRISPQASEPIPYEQLMRAWPGASGDIVCTSGSYRGFHGREKEMKMIESNLLAKDRPRSIMVFGQRRIGKTSTLLELVRSRSPKEGSLCAAFLDVSDLSIPQDIGVSRAFFKRILGSLDAGAENEPIREVLRSKSEHQVDINKLAKAISPETSFADAMEKLAHKLEDISDRKISRIAFFVDEFDRFVAPIGSARKEEIDTLMWSIRQIVQRSQRIAFVLAGSGLQRLFTGDYHKALFGSIDEIELSPFSWEADRDAVEKTFMPAGFRRQLCKDDEFEDLCYHAFTISGGHPWFLSMLGYSAAMISKGRMLTKSFLNHVVERMMAGDFDSNLVPIDAGRFYKQTVFESIDFFDRRERSVAKIILAHIAERTSTEYSWITMLDAIQAPELLQSTKERERLEAISMLEKIGVLERNKAEARVRIRIPLTARAVREDSFIIREDALNDLHELDGSQFT